VIGNPYRTVPERWVSRYPFAVSDESGASPRSKS